MLRKVVELLVLLILKEMV